MSVTKPKVSLEKVLHLLRKPEARLVRLHSNNDGAKFYVWPRGGRVSDEVAQLLLKRDDIQPHDSGLLPGHPQSWRRVRRARRLRQIARRGLSRYSRARCGRRPKVGAEMTRRNQPEAALQRSVIQHLTWRARPGAFFFHVPLGGYRTCVEGAILKAIGTVAGVPDIICIFEGRCYALELKAERGRVTDVQRMVHERLREAGANVAVAHGIDQALAQLERWQLLRSTSPFPPIRLARSASRASR